MGRILAAVAFIIIGGTVGAVGGCFVGYLIGLVAESIFPSLARKMNWWTWGEIGVGVGAVVGALGLTWLVEIASRGPKPRA